jgi:anti-sigma B factor antagonist
VTDGPRLPEFHAKTTLIGRDVALVAVAGELDLYTAGEFAEALNEAIATKPGTVVVDLSAATFVDSTALGTLVHRAKLLGSSGRLAIVATDPQIRRVFDVTGLSHVYPTYGSVELALAGLVPEAERV